MKYVIKQIVKSKSKRLQDLAHNKLKTKSKSEHLQDLTHNKFKKCIRKKHTIENPDFFEIDEIFIENNTNDNKNFDVYLVKGDFKIFSHNEFYRHIQTD